MVSFAGCRSFFVSLRQGWQSEDMSSYFLLHVWESAFNVIYLLPLKTNKCKNDECEKTIGTPFISGGG